VKLVKFGDSVVHILHNTDTEKRLSGTICRMLTMNDMSAMGLFVNVVESNPDHGFIIYHQSRVVTTPLCILGLGINSFVLKFSCSLEWAYMHDLKMQSSAQTELVALRWQFIYILL
jgi:hypothetical protein